MYTKYNENSYKISQNLIKTNGYSSEDSGKYFITTPRGYPKPVNLKTQNLGLWTPIYNFDGTVSDLWNAGVVFFPKTTGFNFSDGGSSKDTSWTKNVFFIGNGDFTFTAFDEENKVFYVANKNATSPNIVDNQFDTDFAFQAPIGYRYDAFYYTKNFPYCDAIFGDTLLASFDRNIREGDLLSFDIQHETKNDVTYITGEYLFLARKQAASSNDLEFYHNLYADTTMLEGYDKNLSYFSVNKNSITGQNAYIGIRLVG